MSATWPWLVLAGLGAYHGVNPAMGWLFAVALGLHRRSRAAVLLSLIPIALGHALAIGLFAAAVAAAGNAVSPGVTRASAAILLVSWALYHGLYGVRHRARVGLRAGFAGLLLWSFVMASTHGAGLMVTPALIPLCLPASAGAGPLGTPLLAVALHTMAMLSVTAVIAVLVYDWLGLGFLRRGWLNLDRVWSAALLLSGLALLMTQPPFD